MDNVVYLNLENKERELMPKQQIKKYHLEKGQTERLQFGLHDFEALENANLCLTQEPHNHSFYQIIYFKKTKGIHVIDFVDYSIEPDTLVFVAKNQIHFFEQNIEYDGLLVHFNESFLIASETDINFFLTYNIFNNVEKPFFKIPERLINQVNNYFAQIRGELTNVNEFGNSSILSNLLKSLLLIIEREMRKEPGDREPANNPHLTYLKFRNLLEHKFKNGWSVSEYASELSISTKTLNSIIKKETEKTVSQVIQDRIILEAKRQLTHTNLFVNQIAYDLGFQDPYYFIKYFKKQVNCSPKEFRRTISQFS
ncbi:MAG: AraC family transcriptional activator of pobA [Cyclobacteriaceae bacterium]